jgi:hypothetical protein
VAGGTTRQAPATRHQARRSGRLTPSLSNLLSTKHHHETSTATNTPSRPAAEHAPPPHATPSTIGCDQGTAAIDHRCRHRDRQQRQSVARGRVVRWDPGAAMDPWSACRWWRMGSRDLAVSWVLGWPCPRCLTREATSHGVRLVSSLAARLSRSDSFVIHGRASCPVY